MALSDDQKAILRLLNQRGEQGYEDLSALMGIGVAEIYRRAKQAADHLEAEGIPAPEIPAPPGGGGDGDFPSVAKDGEAPPGESPSPEPPPTVPAEPQEPAPEIVHSTEAPRAKRQPNPLYDKDWKPSRKKGPTGHHLKEEAHRLKLLENRGLWAIVAGVAIVVVFLVFIFVGGDEDGSSDSSSPTANTDCNVITAASKPTGKGIEELAVATAKGGKEPTRAVLNPVDGSEAGGLAVFGRVRKSLALQIVAEGLDASSNCEYTIWLAASPEKMLPLASTDPDKGGRISAQVEIPVEILAYLANETFGQIAITRTDQSQLKASLAKATKQRKAPLYTGEEVLRGEVKGPIVGAAKRLEEEGE